MEGLSLHLEQAQFVINVLTSLHINNAEKIKN